MQYIKEDIENMLKEHKQNEGKLFEIELKIDEYQNRLDYAGTVYEDTEKEVIENMQLAGQPYDSIHSNTNKISDKVANTALNYEKEQYHINKEDRTFLENEIVRLNEEKNILNKKIVRVKNWLDKINEKEEFVLKEFYINNKGKDWNKVVDEYNEKYKKKTLTDRQLRTIRDKAIQNVLKIVNV
ncbi:MAG: hypothetical protein HFJ41_03860 [Clostridia bacterium]|nr:hypothetical protein [Clostridia bacterium]